ncbi:MAG: AAA family ATPase [Chloroflexi bacterium AL-W]|nr:AAA family ATPase [Chloroflexi bacterium AL-N1]NOK68961.1 AAA family ATPase [Chloroflexi bacterium AL-N10]NOK76944.1 AAA family ATPase [Chloroflexi bacterium AL-N5]NOK82668.1 AAA family ATPase [Chloroflexi bacterium AL-W]NOK90801.1 AAA family ATPase [Chloroflexi bacterium AL-N15]
MSTDQQRPLSTNRYRDDLDRAIDEQIDKVFHRWNWKLARLIRTVLLIAGAIWLIVNVIPSLWGFLTSGNIGQSIIQFLFIGGYLFFFIGFQFFLMYYFMARTRIYWVKPGETGVSFDDYKGNPEVMEAAKRIVTLLKGVKEFKDMGGETTRGVLLVGPPGTGKSYLAQAISTEAGVPFGYLSAPSLTSAWMGMGNIKVMNLYRKARKLAREYGACILFIDEIDAVGGARSSSMASGAAGMDASSSTGGYRGMMMGGMGGMGGNSGILNELLLQMDPPPQETSLIAKLLRSIGLRKKKVEMPPVLTMGATNLAESLDAALLRPGRFDRKITVDKPDTDGRREIIEYYLNKVKHEPMPMDRMISDTIGYTPVAIKYVINEAVIHAHFDQRQAINYWDFTHARETHEMGLKQPIRGMSYEERRRIAYHEAGHAYAMVKLLRKERLTKVTIIRHGNALGFAAWKPEEEIHTRTKAELLARLQVSLASRAAEEIFLDIQMSGVTGDLQSATGLASFMVGAYGMDKSFFSYLTFGMQGMASGEIKGRVEAILNEEFRKVKVLLENNKEAVTAIAEALILRNELTDIDVKEILNRIEAVYPFTVEGEASKPTFGFQGMHVLPTPVASVRRSGRYIYVNDNGQYPVPVAAKSPDNPQTDDVVPANPDPPTSTGEDT